MLISLITKFAQSMQISVRHSPTPQTMYITFPLKTTRAVNNISGLTHCLYIAVASGLSVCRKEEEDVVPGTFLKSLRFQLLT